ncbi:hypothetical protein POSPLADRAFT_1039782 [Postia placenta MAD-698-R-SB12]|uniref:Uncharacterized protein n=1 Tax=Postia placenta MAD-698-R-SB12 TaxID=670580 RepID=A0A1X6N305_9APHY|nr:hypothetical protein POSPLADRAFT_1039782 [Postia placenta MAD-698-R-SB12]OSX62900.1 hypothetical protein POSPLADRAFT_1039782 [Postia placenta MAD-698-R-SB12]
MRGQNIVLLLFALLSVAFATPVAPPGASRPGMPLPLVAGYRRPVSQPTEPYRPRWLAGGLGQVSLRSGVAREMAVEIRGKLIHYCNIINPPDGV